WHNCTYRVCVAPGDLLHCPTRRSSDRKAAGSYGESAGRADEGRCRCRKSPAARPGRPALQSAPWPRRRLKLLGVSPVRRRKAVRSEEHTSELQSRENLVCRLLLEKKKD